MSIGRPAIIAVQAIVVGVLVVVVYLTLLQPEDEGTLSGVGGAQITQREVPGEDRRDGREDQGGGDGGSPDSVSDGAGQVVDSAFVPGTAGTAVAPLPVTPAAPTTVPESEPDDSEDEPDDSEEEPDDPGGEPGTPDGDQYQDAVTRLTEQLR
jgi:hypothetical protein